MASGNGEPGMDRLRRFRTFLVPPNADVVGDPQLEWGNAENVAAYAEWRKHTTRSEWIRTIRNIYLSAWYANGRALSIDRASLQAKMEGYFPGSQLRLILAPPGLTRLGDTFQRPFHPIPAGTPLFTYYASQKSTTKPSRFTLKQDCVVLHRFKVQGGRVEALAPLMLVLVFDAAKPSVSKLFYLSTKARHEESVQLFEMEGRKCSAKSKFGFTSLLETFPGCLRDLLAELRASYLSLDLTPPAFAWKLHEYHLRPFFPNGYSRTIQTDLRVPLEIKDFNLEPWADVIWPGQLMYRIKPHALYPTPGPAPTEEMSVWNDHEYDVMLPFESRCAQNILDMSLLATKLTDDFDEAPPLNAILAGKDAMILRTIDAENIQSSAHALQEQSFKILKRHQVFVSRLQAPDEEVVKHFYEIYAVVLRRITRFTARVMKLLLDSKPVDPKPVDPKPMGPARRGLRSRNP